MKQKLHILVLWIGLCCILGMAVQAQESVMEIQQDFRQEMQAMFGSLEAERIPHGILVGYVFPFADLNAYNGTFTDNTAIDIGVF